METCRSTDAVWQFSGFIEEHENIFPESLVLWAKKTRLSGKDKASDSPSWVDSLDDYVRPGESGKDFAKRVCDEKFGPGNYPTGQASDYNRIKKRVDRDPNYKRMPNER